MHFRSVLASAAIALTALLQSPHGADADSVEDKALLCAGCHGDDGVPQEKTTPIIWGQKLGYLYIQLRDYKRGDRKNEVMQALAESLERDEMLALAEYFSNKLWPDLGQPAASKEVAERAVRANGSVGCTGCHLDKYQGDGTVPRLTGMSREYLAKTIAEFRTRSRGNNPGMSDLMMATSEEDLDAMVEYLAGR